MMNIDGRPLGLISAMIAGLVFAPAAFAASPWEMGVKNTGGGGYSKGYSSYAVCAAEHPHDGGGCEKAFQDCGAPNADVFMTLDSMKRVVDPSFGNTIVVYRWDTSSDGPNYELCRGTLQR